jgi:hypothetical protein
MMKKQFYIVCLLFLLSFNILTAETLFLRDNLRRAEKGDYIVTNQGKTYSLLRIYDKTTNGIAIEEITVPSNKIPKSQFSWRDWVLQGAPNASSRIVYHIDLEKAAVDGRFCLTQTGWCETGQRDNFLTTLLNLNLQPIPLQQRRRVGIPGFPGTTEKRALWQPQVIVDGQIVQGVQLDAWQTTWPKDGTDLAGKQIEAYLPAANSGFPSYFPYWLQVNGTIINAKIRIIDSGKNLYDPRSNNSP